MAEPGGGEGSQHPIRDKVKKTVAAGTAAVTFAATGVSYPASPDFRKPDVTTTTSVIHTTEHKTITNEYPEIYARLFSKDPEAGKLVYPSDVVKEYNIINNLIKAGYRIDQPISDIGVASDDDDTTINGIRTGGLGVHNEKDAHLGDVRGTIYEKLLDGVFEEHGMKPPDIAASGVEAVLGEKVVLPNNIVLNLDTKTIQEDIKYLRKIAKQKGTTVGTLVDEYNGINGDLPPGSEKLQGVLDKLLKGKREVIITFNVTDETGHIVKVVHKRHVPPIWFVPIADLTEEFAPKKPDEDGYFPEPKVKLNRGFAQPVERIK
ncbi:MAG TPA: hypothetical protein VND99_03755, partial [Candidatus Acidoferrales bacterium]|nr:hypothetical protein [Candidatus Acidoferrales bacterium]